MGGRTHDYHCRNCHTWVNGFAVDDGATCGCGRWDGFYDLNHDGCEGGCPERVECGATLAVAGALSVTSCPIIVGHASPHKVIVAFADGIDGGDR